MRVLFLKLSLLTMAVAMQLAAADLYLGTWKLDTAKSKYDPGPGPKSLTSVLSVDGDWIVTKTEGVAADGKSTTTSNRYKRDGKDYPWNTATESGKSTISIKMMDDHHTVATVKRDGKAISTSKNTISKDGKTRTMATTGTNAEGKKFSNVAVFTRQ